MVTFDYRSRIAHFPRLVQVMLALEWMYIPAVEIMMHLLVLILRFTMQNRRHQRKLVVTVLVICGGILATVFYVSLAAILLYAIAYMLFLTVMRFMDVDQHIYEIFETLDQPCGADAKRFNQDYEQRNTFSNIISLHHPRLNRLVLNVSYHNAHYEKPTAPWYRLPELHQQLFGNDRTQVFAYINLLKSYHEYRVPRNGGSYVNAH